MHQQNLESTCQTEAQVVQQIIIIFSALSCVYTMWKIKSYNLLQNPFAFLIFCAQLSFFVIALIDLSSKIPQENHSQKVWCNIVTPIVYGLILMTFVFIEMFCIMLYRTVSNQNYGFLNKNIRKICILTTIFAIAINCVGVTLFQMGICQNCTIPKTTNTIHEYFSVYIVYFDYFGPIILSFFIIFLFIKLRRRYRNKPTQKRMLKIFWIPLWSMIFLIFNNNIVSNPYIAKKLQNIPNLIHIILYQALYFVPFVNLFFYTAFVKAFQLDSQKDNNCFGCCFKRQQDESDLLYTITDKQERTLSQFN